MVNIFVSIFFANHTSMKSVLYLDIILMTLPSTLIHAQELPPKSITEDEEAILDTYLLNFSRETATNPLEFTVRSMAEWEEIKAGDDKMSLKHIQNQYELFVKRKLKAHKVELLISED